MSWNASSGSVKTTRDRIDLVDHDEAARRRPRGRCCPASTRRAPTRPPIGAMMLVKPSCTCAKLICASSVCTAASSCATSAFCVSTCCCVAASSRDQPCSAAGRRARCRAAPRPAPSAPGPARAAPRACAGRCCASSWPAFTSWPSAKPTRSSWPSMRGFTVTLCARRHAADAGAKDRHVLRPTGAVVTCTGGAGRAAGFLVGERRQARAGDRARRAARGRRAGATAMRMRPAWRSCRGRRWTRVASVPPASGASERAGRDQPPPVAAIRPTLASAGGRAAARRCAGSTSDSACAVTTAQVARRAGAVLASASRSASCAACDGLVLQRRLLVEHAQAREVVLDLLEAAQHRLLVLRRPRRRRPRPPARRAPVAQAAVEQRLRQRGAERPDAARRVEQAAEAGRAAAAARARASATGSTRRARRRCWRWPRRRGARPRRCRGGARAVRTAGRSASRAGAPGTRSAGERRQAELRRRAAGEDRDRVLELARAGVEIDRLRPAPLELRLGQRDVGQQRDAGRVLRLRELAAPARRPRRWRRRARAAGR